MSENPYLKDEYLRLMAREIGELARGTRSLELTDSIIASRLKDFGHACERLAQQFFAKYDKVVAEGWVKGGDFFDELADLRKLLAEGVSR